LEEVSGVFTALTEALVLVGVPGAALLDDVGSGRELEQVAFHGEAFAVEDVEFDFLERSGHLVFDHLDASPVADDVLAVLESGDTTNVKTHGGIELEGVTTGGGFRVAEHDADFHPDLVDEDHEGLAAIDR